MILVDGERGKFCPDCQQHLPQSSFTRNKRSIDGLAFYCRVCARARLLASKRRRLGPPKTRTGQGPRDLPDEHKWCARCNDVKALSEFPRNRSARDGYGSYCKPCHNAAGQASRAKHGGARNYHLRRRYGMTAAAADRMLAEQNGVCAIYLEAPAVHVDHDHATGRVRGLLCFNCNGALGQFRDRADLMTRAALYLTLGAGAVAATAHFESAFATTTAESARPHGEDDSYLFEFLDAVEPV